MELEQIHSNSQLAKIFDEATVYMCACPAQVAEMIGKLRHLYAYQQGCQQRGISALSQEVHERIATATREAHRVMETCLQDILRIEEWDPETLEMPAGLRELRDREISE